MHKVWFSGIEQAFIGSVLPPQPPALLPTAFADGGGLSRAVSVASSSGTSPVWKRWHILNCSYKSHPQSPRVALGWK